MSDTKVVTFFGYDPLGLGIPCFNSVRYTPPLFTAPLVSDFKYTPPLISPPRKFNRDEMYRKVQEMKLWE